MFRPKSNLIESQVSTAACSASGRRIVFAEFFCTFFSYIYFQDMSGFPAIRFVLTGCTIPAHSFFVPNVRGCTAFGCFRRGGRPGNPVPSHSLSDTIFLYTDIGRTRSDGFSSAASRLITLPFFTNFFIAGGRAIRQAVVVKGVWVRLLGYVPLFSGYSNYLFDRCSITRSGRGAKRLFPAFINYFFFSGGRSRQAVARVTSCARWTESPELCPPFLRLYEQFFIITLDWMGRTPERLQERFGRSAFFYAYRYENRI
jgi:hypothetical protein